MRWFLMTLVIWFLSGFALDHIQHKKCVESGKVNDVLGNTMYCEDNNDK